MAPPQNRRSGFSRRAQYGLFASYVVAIAGVLVGLLLALTARFDPQGHAAIQGIFADLTSPISGAARGASGTVGSGIDGIGAYIEAGSKNRAMEAELRAARTKLVEAQALARENVRLQKLAKLVETHPDTIVSARLIASTGTSTRRFATLGAGSVQGIATGQPVRSPDGLVGRVVAAARITARVLLITDGGNVVPVRRISDGMPALATGRGDGMLDIRALEAGQNPFKVGDLFVTSGAGGVYPPNVPVAIVRQSNREAGIARPFADPNRLDFAIVLPPYAPPAPTLPVVEGTP
ncbi:MAG: rod shape-determining protein MreC [Sphingomonadales bacterium]